VTLEEHPDFVHVISHGPQCLDGVTAAVAVARYYRHATVRAQFSSNTEINARLRALRCDPPEATHAVWITDISWTDPQVDRHLQGLIDRGVTVCWIDHHRTALERVRRGEVTVQLTHQVLSEAFAASRLTYEYLRAQLLARGTRNEWFAALRKLVEMADDNDRWLHRIHGSRRLALILATPAFDAYEQLLHIDADVTYTPQMRRAEQQLETALARSFDVAARSRVVRELGNGRVVTTAVCDGYPSEIADAWGKTAHNTIFAFFDTQSLTVSLRRSPDCTADLSDLAEALGGGGHAAAAGCELPELRVQVAEALAHIVERGLTR
jgi:hypothetical protein